MIHGTTIFRASSKYSRKKFACQVVTIKKNVSSSSGTQFACIIKQIILETLALMSVSQFFYAMWAEHNQKQ